MQRVGRQRSTEEHVEDRIEAGGSVARREAIGGDSAEVCRRRVRMRWCNATAVMGRGVNAVITRENERAVCEVEVWREDSRTLRARKERHAQWCRLEQK